MATVWWELHIKITRLNVSKICKKSDEGWRDGKLLMGGALILYSHPSCYTHHPISGLHNLKQRIPSPTRVVFVYNASNSLVNTLLLFSPAAFRAAVSVCFTTPTLWPLLTNLKIIGCQYDNTMPVSHMGWRGQLSEVQFLVPASCELILNLVNGPTNQWNLNGSLVGQRTTKSKCLRLNTFWRTQLYSLGPTLTTNK